MKVYEATKKQKLLMKKLNKLILISYIPPFFATFFIALFILLMQFVFKYIDDLVGKGLPWYTIGLLMFYASASLVPMALPLAILLSSIMTFGNFSEQFELVASKAAGVSLQKLMRPLILFSIGISFSAFLFSNYILPIANLKFGRLLYDITHQKPALSIKPGIFYRGIDGYVIKVGNKDNSTDTLGNLMIYDHTAMQGNIKLITATKGLMKMSEDTTVMLAYLYNGNSFEEVQDAKDNFHPFMRTHYEREIMRFDLESFKMVRTNENLFKDNYQMLNVKQLTVYSDSLKKMLANRKKDFSVSMVPMYSFKRDTLPDSISKAITLHFDLDKPIFIDNFSKQDQSRIFDNALNLARNGKAYTDNIVKEIDGRQKLIARHEIEWHRKFTLSFACLLLFFIGAPLGAIIRKGGLGLPVIFSVLIFITYHIITITGEKFAREGVTPAYKGMWISSIILLPLGIFLTYKATTDSAIFDRDRYFKFFSNIIGIFRKKPGTI
jgi:lipopolysaccharide export system permease protein